MKSFTMSLGSLIIFAGCAEPTGTSGTSGGVGTSANSSAPAPSAASPGTEGASDVQVKLLNHSQIQELIKGHGGKVVVMDCWSTSCEPCIKEFPNLVALHKKHGADKVACISLSFDFEGLGKPEEIVPVVQKFLESQGAAFHNIVCTEDSDTLYKKMNLASVPAVYVYSVDGELAKRFDNEDAGKPPFNYEQVGELVTQLLK